MGEVRSISNLEVSSELLQFVFYIVALATIVLTDAAAMSQRKGTERRIPTTLTFTIAGETFTSMERTGTACLRW